MNTPMGHHTGWEEMAAFIESDRNWSYADYFGCLNVAIVTRKWFLSYVGYDWRVEE